MDNGLFSVDDGLTEMDHDTISYSVTRVLTTRLKYKVLELEDLLQMQINKIYIG